jgi:hypothetical protein
VPQVDASTVGGLRIVLLLATRRFFLENLYYQKSWLHNSPKSPDFKGGNTHPLSFAGRADSDFDQISRIQMLLTTREGLLQLIPAHFIWRKDQKCSVRMPSVIGKWP